MARAAVAAESAGKKIHATRARRLAEFGLAEILQDGRVILDASLRQTVEQLQQHFYDDVLARKAG